MARRPASRSRRKGHPQALDENLETVETWERTFIHQRTPAEKFSDWVTGVFAGGASVVGHAVWFGGWILINTGLLPIVKPFDPFPFQLLTMTVSLEAIFLSLFVLASQNRLSRQADKRAHLDLQIDLLAEREMTGVLQLVEAIAKHLKITKPITPELRDLAEKTDIKGLVDQLDRNGAQKAS